VTGRPPTEHEREFRVMSLASVEYAHHVALCIERLLRRTDDEAERTRLRAWRDWHYARLGDEQILRDRERPPTT
jgi:hypothetical protein